MIAPKTFTALAVVLLVVSCFLPAYAREPLQVGVARVDITPPLGYPMSGYYHERGATGVLDPLEAKTLVFLQGETAVALCICDVIGIPSALTAAVRRRASKETQIPERNIIVAATHTHTGPAFGRDLAQHLGRTSGDREEPKTSTDYPEVLIDSITQSIVAAAKDAAPARLSIGSAYVENVSFNRRFLLKDGSARTWARLSDPEVVRAAGPIDSGLGCLYISPQDTWTARAVLAVFALHLDMTGGTQFSADFPHYMEEALREKLGDDFTLVFGAGTCGDINHVDPTGAPRKKPSETGRILADAVATLTELRAVEPSLAVASRVVHVPLAAATEERIEWARGIVDRDRRGEKLEFLTEVDAYKILAVAALRENQPVGHDNPLAAEPPDGTFPVDVHAIRLGPEAAIVTLPGEVFVELGLEIKRRSPFAQTMVIELACSNDTKYIPTRAAYAQGSYEPTNSALAPGSGEQLVSAAVELLEELAGESPKE